MASAISPNMLWPPCMVLKSEKRVQSRISIKCCFGGESDDQLTVNGAAGGVASLVKDKKEKPVEGHVSLKVEKKKEEKLEPLWDDGYGDTTVKDFFDYAVDLIKVDNGPPRWFTPIACGPHLKNSPVLLFMAGLDGVGLGLILHHKSMGKVFDVWCLHIPLKDRTSFEGLVSLVEETVRAQHKLSPKKPIYLAGDSFGGCLALAVAARNPDIDLILILSNPATSFGRSELQPLLPLLVSLPKELHVTVPYLLSLVMGDPIKMAAVGIESAVPPPRYFEEFTKNLASLLPKLSVMADMIPKENLDWKIKLLKTGSAYANSRLQAVTAEVLILASGKDNVLPSLEEGWRLSKSLKNCTVRYFKDNGHAILLEDGVNLLSVIKSTCFYRRSRKRDYVHDFIPPSMSDFKQDRIGYQWFQRITSPVMYSTTEDGNIVRGLAGVPVEGPVLLIGYHMLLGLEIIPLIGEFLKDKKIMVRGMAHPSLFTGLDDSNRESSAMESFRLLDNINLFGGVPATPTNLFKLLETKSHVLLYPGGVREACHKKGEEYKLFWPEQPEFVRMAAKFGAKIVPFGAIGEDDIAELALDYDDLMKIPILSDEIKKLNDETVSNIRAGMSGEVANQHIHVPFLLPKVPGRVYYYFGKAIETRGRFDGVNDKETAKELYFEVKSQVEANLAFLRKKRSQDPYRNIVNRTVYQAFNASADQVPAFEP